MSGGGGGHASATGGQSGAGHSASHGTPLSRATAPVTSHLTAASHATPTTMPKKPGFWRRHFHRHSFSNTATINNYVACTEEDVRLGRCPERTPKRP